MFRLILRHPLFIAFVALVARLLAILPHYSGSGQRLADIWNNGYEMSRMAGMVASGAGFSSPFSVVSGPSAIVPPGYPLLLAAIFRVFGIRTTASAFVTIALQEIMAGAVCVLIYYIGRRALGEPAGVAGAWIWALYPSATIVPGVFLWDATLTALLATLGFLLAMRLDAGERRDWIIFGLLWGAAGLVNPSVLPVFGVLMLRSCWQRRRIALPWRGRAIACLLITIALLTPWTVRNYRVFGKLVPIRDNFGMELWIGNHAGGDGTMQLLLHPVGSLAETEQFRRRGELGYIAWKQQQAVEFISGHPLQFLGLTWKRFVWFWSGVQGLTIVWDCMLVALLALAGLARLARLNRGELARFALPLLIYPLPFCLTHADLKYRHTIEPLLALLAGFAIAGAVASLRGLRSSQRPNELEEPARALTQSPN
jgi:4-amino-4-deoxy-L-arabinose transferase-like glycosyltransferase